MWLKTQSALFLLIFFACHFSCQGEVFSCNGYVESFVPDVLAKLKIKLLTAEGNLKYETDCTPSNGNFMIPVYNKGSYVIKIDTTEGFIFHPSQIPITINGVNDPCTLGEDINFHLFGFSVNGKVRSGESDGPSRFNLALFDEAGKEYATTTTDEKGAYSFEASPGKYVLSARDHTQCVERGSVQVEVKDHPVTANDIRISGHSLHVAVTNEKGKKLENAKVVLISEQNIPFEKQVVSPKPAVAQVNKKFEYTLTTDGSGNVIFPCLPPAAYIVRPFWSGKKTNIIFSPTELKITVTSNLEKVTFKADGFNAVGVVQVNKRPLNAVDIYIDGKKVAQTGIDGTYTIDRLTTGRHKVEAKLEHYTFKQLDLEISIENAELPPIEVTKIEVCGTMNVEDTSALYDSKAIIEVSTAKNAIEELVEVNPQNGKFCVFLRPEVYKFKPVLKGARLNPEITDVTVKDVPIFDLVFTEFRATVSGHVQCLSSDECIDTTVHLMMNGELVEKSNVAESGDFSFKNISPGQYRLQVVGKKSVCWKDEELELKIVSKNVDNVNFKQTGYQVNVHSSKSAVLKWSGNRASGSIAIKPGFKSTFCVPKAGNYEFKLESCYKFKQTESFKYSVPSESILSLEPEKSYFSSSILFGRRSANFEQELSVHERKTASNHTFVTWIDQNLSGSSITVEPKSEKHLFSPSSHEIVFEGDCLFNAASFRAVEGKYVTGDVKPAVSDVNVKVTNKENGETLTGKTDRNGKFSIGPVWDPKLFEDVQLELQGYRFSPTNNRNSFKSTKLSKLQISYFDEATKKPLPEVLISLSGGDNYRSNSVVDENGQYVFVGLPAGEYFVRSVLREYRFEPTSTPVTIKEGETIELKMFGQRYAYSAFGKVLTAGGIPVNQMTVEAISKNCGNLQEEDVSDEEGAFRVRNLKPNCDYEVHLRTSDGKLPSIPPFIEIKTEEHDQENLVFTVMSTSQLNEIFGMINCNSTLKCGSLRVELFEDGALKSHVQLSANERVFYFTNSLSLNKEYRVSVSESDLRALDATSNSVSFVAKQLSKTVLLNLKPKERKPEIETSTSSFFGVIFVILSTLVFLNLNFSRDLLLTLIDQIRAVVLQHGGDGSSLAADRKRKQRKN
ncbi:hypothetical protein M3Y98_00300800 [Aphelenchoides besseyi]|nr:hypothetical protein M3Y98_00300800 [Aphelenchoides besseyi]